ncbi:MAG TPA: hypothetical protein VFG20_05400 [Planctomycetaceae bacterium]|nr:hypothetical protein [Planctomycetaceae bacterium]
MIPPHDVVADLPAPLDDEPPSVRQDIADELADHLACAYRRELLKTADARTAQQRVLDRFGNPQRIASQLWFQALWGRIMLNRLGRVVQVLKIVGGLLVLFFVFRMAEQQSALQSQLAVLAASNNTMHAQAAGNRMMLEQIARHFPATQPDMSSSMSGMAGGMMAMGGAPGMEMGGSSAGGSMMGGMPMGSGAANPPQHGLKLNLVMDGEKNEPASGCLVSVFDENWDSLTAFNSFVQPEGMGAEGGMGMMAMGMTPGGMPAGHYGTVNSAGKPAVRLPPEQKGVLYFSKSNDQRIATPLEPGRYTVSIQLPDGRVGTHRFVVPPRHQAGLHEEQIVCPAAAQKAYVTFHAALMDKKFVDAGGHIRAELTGKPLRRGKTDWTSTTDPQSWTIFFDPVSGAPIGYERVLWRKGMAVERLPLDLSDLPTEERFVVMPAGDYVVEITWFFDSELGGGLSKSIVNTTFPAAGAATEGALSLSTDTRDVLLEFPAGAVEQLEKVLFPQSSATKAVEPGAPADAASVTR